MRLLKVNNLEKGYENDFYLENEKGELHGFALFYCSYNIEKIDYVGYCYNGDDKGKSYDPNDKYVKLKYNL